MKTGKIWGVTEDLLRTPFVEVHRLVIEPGFHCSWHKHERKHNAFLCLEGVLHIEVRKAYGLVDCTTLHPGDICTVPPGEEHRFIVNKQGSLVRALEIYYPDILTEDIVRTDNGGPNK